MNILLLTDFSSNALHAAKYASSLCHQWQANVLLLLHARQQYGIVGNEKLEEVNRLIEDNQLALLELKEQVAGWVPPHTTVIIRQAGLNLEEGINEICEELYIDLVVMGITGKSGIEKALIGSNATRVIEQTRFPVLVVPPAAGIQDLQTVVLTTDLEAVKEKLNTHYLDSILRHLQARLLVLNVAQQEGDAVNLRNEIAALHEILDKYHPELHYINHPDTAEGIHRFALEHDADLLLVFHQQHSGIAALFHKSIANKLCWHSTVPLMVIPV